MAQKDFAFTYVGDKQGDEGIVRSFPEGAGQTFKAGDLVLLATNACANAIAVGSNLGAVTNTILGFAQKDASGVTGTMIPVRMIRQSDIFKAPLGAAQTFVETDVNITGCEIKRTAAGFWTVDRGTTTNTALIILGTTERSATGALAATAGGSVYVKFRASYLFLGL